MENLHYIKEEESEQNPYIGSTSELEPHPVVRAEIESPSASPEHKFTHNVEQNTSTGSTGSGQLFQMERSNGLMAKGFNKQRPVEKRKKKRKSRVWKHFRWCGFETAICNYCAVSIKTPRGSTSSMARHLLMHVKHKKGESGYKYLDSVLTSETAINVTQKELPSQSKEDKDIRPPGVVTEKVAMSVDRFKVITEKLVLMMIKGCHNPCVVQDSGFRDLINELEPKYQIPSKSYFSNVYIPDLYEKCFAKMKKEFGPIISKAISCSLTVDSWMSCDSTSNVAISCHHMSEDFKIIRKFLKNAQFPGKQSGHEMFRIISSVLEEWAINDSEVHVITDDSRDLAAAASKSSWMVLPCFAHSLHLAILGAKTCTQDYGDVIHKARELAWRYSVCSVARKDLQSIQAAKDMPVEEMLSDFGEGRSWNSEYQFLKRFAENKEAIQEELAGKKDVMQLSKEDWELLEEVVLVLKPIDEAMNDFCADTYPPLSMTIPIIYGIEHMLMARIEEKGFCNLSAFSRNLLKGVRSRFPSYKANRSSLIAMVLDPRYKAVVLTETETNLAAKMLVDEITGGVTSGSPLKGQGSVRTGKNVSPSTGVRHVPNASSLWSAFEKVTKELPPVSEKKLAMYQVKQYLDESVIPRMSEPLTWWSENRERYDLLAPVAKKYESIPATGVKGNILITTSPDKRQCLTGSNVEQLVFLRENS